MAKILTTQDIETFKNTIMDSFTATPLDADYPFNGVGYNRIKSGTEAPYILLYRTSAVPVNAFGAIAYYDCMYVFDVVTVATDTKSAEQWATLIHERLMEILHLQKIEVDGFKTMVIKLGPSEPDDWEVVDDETQYYHSPYKWLAQFAPLP